MGHNSIIIGAGGCGRNILEAIQELGETSARLVHVNTDRLSIKQSTIRDSILLERLNANYITSMVDLEPYDEVLLVAGLGGATGTAVMLALAEKCMAMGKDLDTKPLKNTPPALNSPDFSHSRGPVRSSSAISWAF